MKKPTNALPPNLRALLAAFYAQGVSFSRYCKAIRQFIEESAGFRENRKIMGLMNQIRKFILESNEKGNVNRYCWS
jgi:hypothetical protein